jgi:hypothetical protein
MQVKCPVGTVPGQQILVRQYVNGILQVPTDVLGWLMVGSVRLHYFFNDDVALFGLIV